MIKPSISLLFAVLALGQALPSSPRARHPSSDADEVMEGDLPMELAEMIELVAHQQARDRRIQRARARGAGRQGNPPPCGWGGRGDEGNQPIRPWSSDDNDATWWEPPSVPSEEARKRFMKKYCPTGRCRLPDRSRRAGSMPTAGEEEEGRRKKGRKAGQPGKYRPLTPGERDGIRAVQQSLDRTRGKARQQPHRRPIRRCAKGQPRDDRPIVPWNIEDVIEPKIPPSWQRQRPRKIVPIVGRNGVFMVMEVETARRPIFGGRNPLVPPHRLPKRPAPGRRAGQPGRKLEAHRRRPGNAPPSGRDELGKEHEPRRGSHPPMDRPPRGPEQPPLDGPKHRQKCPFRINWGKWQRKTQRLFHKIRTRFGEASGGEQAVVVAGILAIIAMQIWVIGKCISFATATANDGHEYGLLISDEESGPGLSSNEKMMAAKSTVAERGAMLD